MSNDVADFYEQMTDEDKATAKESTNNAADTEKVIVKREFVPCAGVFLMKPIEEAYYYEGDLIRYPSLGVSGSGNMKVAIKLIVEDKIEDIPDGCKLVVHQPILAKPGSSAEKHDKIQNFAKPRIKVLTGIEDSSEINFANPVWAKENLTIGVSTEGEGDKKKVKEITRSSKLNKLVMVTLKDGFDNNGNPQVQVVRMDTAKEGDKSIVDIISFNDYRKRVEELAKSGDEREGKEEGFGSNNETPENFGTPPTDSSTGQTVNIDDELPF